METITDAVGFIFVCVVGIALTAIICLFFISHIIPQIKDTVYPPCIDCKHCNVVNEESCSGHRWVEYRCSKARYKIDGDMDKCDDARGEYHCVFKRKD